VNDLRAAELAAGAVPVASRSDLIGDVRARVQGERYESLHDVVVLDQNRVAGLLDLRELLAAPADALVGDLMDSAPPLANAADDPNVAAHRMIESGESSLVLVDAEGRFRGLVPPEAMISILLREHDEDLARVGGYTAGFDRARGAARESIWHRLGHRMPWLVVGLFGAMLSAVLVAAFEDRLAENVLVALFIPAVVYLAAAVGTQTQAVLIRALASGVTIRSMVAREVVTGAIAGLAIGVLFAVFAQYGWGDERLAVAVGVALFASCTIAIVLAILFPAIFEHFGQDPAFGSGPLATVAQDLVSILVYFGVVVAIGA
jgi:magnesium transporter